METSTTDYLVDYVQCILDTWHGGNYAFDLELIDNEDDSYLDIPTYIDREDLYETTFLNPLAPVEDFYPNIDVITRVLEDILDITAMEIDAPCPHLSGTEQQFRTIVDWVATQWPKALPKDRPLPTIPAPHCDDVLDPGLRPHRRLSGSPHHNSGEYHYEYAPQILEESRFQYLIGTYNPYTGEPETTDDLEQGLWTADLKCAAETIADFDEDQTRLVRRTVGPIEVIDRIM